MFVTYEESGRAKPSVIARYDTFAAAYEAVSTDKRCLMCEMDDDNTNCADAFMNDGRVISIEPASRRNL